MRVMHVMLSGIFGVAVLLGLSLTAEAIPIHANGNAYGLTGGNGNSGNGNGNAYGRTGGNGNGNAYGVLGANGGYSTNNVAVPIPGTLVLLGVGFAGLVGWQLWNTRRRLHGFFQQASL